jgi:uncharacterized phage infection (PIP) family protein YhgE
MTLLFSSRIAKLETMNRILTDAARKRTERIEELEAQVSQLQRQVALLINEKNTELAAVREELTKHAHLINEKNNELAAVREELIKRADLINEKNKELAAVREELIKHADLVNDKNKELAAVREELIKRE